MCYAKSRQRKNNPRGLSLHLVLVARPRDAIEGDQHGLEEEVLPGQIDYCLARINLFERACAWRHGGERENRVIVCVGYARGFSSSRTFLAVELHDLILILPEIVRRFKVLIDKKLAIASTAAGMKPRNGLKHREALALDHHGQVAEDGMGVDAFERSDQGVIIQSRLFDGPAGLVKHHLVRIRCNQKGDGEWFARNRLSEEQRPIQCGNKRLVISFVCRDAHHCRVHLAQLSRLGEFRKEQFLNGGFGAAIVFPHDSNVGKRGVNSDDDAGFMDAFKQESLAVERIGFEGSAPHPLETEDAAAQIGNCFHSIDIGVQHPMNLIQSRGQIGEPILSIR